MGNKIEEVQIEKELDDLDEQEIKINLQLYKLQTEINNRKPEDQQVKLIDNYIDKINKWKSKNNPKKGKNEDSKNGSNDEDEDEDEYDDAQEEHKGRNKKKNKEKKKIKGLQKMKKNLEELENMDKEEEILEIRRNKEKIKNSNYIKELEDAEQEIFEEDVKDEIIRRDIYKNLDTPDLNEKELNSQLSELYNNANDNDNSLYEENYSNDYDLYKKVVKDNTLKDRVDEININFLYPGQISNNIDSKEKKKMKKERNDKYGIEYEYEVKRNKMIEKALENRNHIVKNQNIKKVDNSPYSDYEPSEGKSENISQYY